MITRTDRPVRHSGRVDHQRAGRKEGPAGAPELDPALHGTSACRHPRSRPQRRARLALTVQTAWGRACTRMPSGTFLTSRRRPALRARSRNDRVNANGLRLTHHARGRSLAAALKIVVPALGARSMRHLSTCTAIDLDHQGARAPPVDPNRGHDGAGEHVREITAASLRVRHVRKQRPLAVRAAVPDRGVADANRGDRKPAERQDVAGRELQSRG